MSSILFLGESRRSFAVPSSEGNSQILGSFEMKEILDVEKWQKAEVVTVSFVAPTDWVQNNLFPGRNPAVNNPLYRRARYFTFRKKNGQFSTMVLDSFEAVEEDSENYKVTVVGKDPRAWAEIMTSASGVSTENWKMTRLNTAIALSNRLSNATIQGMQPWQKLPISPLSGSWNPTVAQSALGFRNAAAIAPGGNVEIGAPDPLPVKDSIEDLFANWQNVELYPLPAPGTDGTDSPWWRWAIRTRTRTMNVFSEKDGTLKINRHSGNYRQTETAAYSSSDRSKLVYAAETTIARSPLSGPWAGIRTESHSVPEGANATSYLRSKALTATYQNSRMVMDATIDFTNSEVTPTVGMTANVRIGSIIYQVTVDEIVSSYSSETGWKTTSPIFVSIDSIDLYNPIVTDDIEIIVRTSGTVFYIPVNSPTAADYNFRVYLDGREIGVYSGMSSATEPGIPVTVQSNIDQVIHIQPADGRYSYGWARAFGFSATISGSEVHSANNRGRVNRVISDPDKAHMESIDSYGDNFRAYQWRSCYLLTSVPAEEVQLSVKVIGDNFRREQLFATGLTAIPNEVLPTALVSIGNYFRSGQYESCLNASSAGLEAMPATVKTIGNNFRGRQYYAARISTVAPEVLPGVETVGSSFRLQQYMNSYITAGTVEVNPAVTEHGSYWRASQYQASRITTASPENSPSVQRTQSYWRDSQYRDCTFLKAAAIEGNSPSIVDDYARQYQYYGCIAIPAAAAEYESFEPQTIGHNFRAYQYMNCTILKTAVLEKIGASVAFIGGAYRANMYAATIVSAVVPEVLPSTVRTVGNSFRYGQWSNTAITESTPEVLPEGVNSIGSTFRALQYSGCVKLTTVYPEVIPSSVTTMGSSGYREQQFSGSGVILPAAEAVLNVTEVGQAFRKRQYYNSKVTRPAAEVNLPTVTKLVEDFRYGQYQGCTDLRNPDGLVEGSFAPNVVLGVPGTPSYYQANWRYAQFSGSGIDVALVETPMQSTGNATVGNASYIRAYQYSSCLNLLLPAIEADNPQHYYYDGSYYRVAQYKGSVNLDPSSLNSIETVSRAWTGWGSSYRNEQFAQTKAQNVAGLRAKYKDGTEVIEGTFGIPTTFYS
jgi:hypothetical protein